MGQEFLDMIIQISVFMICARMILHLRIKSSGEKYIKGIVGLMVVAFMVSSMVLKWKDIQGTRILPDIEEMEKRMEEMMKNEMKEMDLGKLTLGYNLDNYIDPPKEEVSIRVEPTIVVIGKDRE